jgi:hypothetical protein
MLGFGVVSSFGARIESRADLLGLEAAHVVGVVPRELLGVDAFGRGGTA